MQVNLEGVFNVTHAFVPALKQTRGCIINLSSIVGFVAGISSASDMASYVNGVVLLVDGGFRSAESA